LFTREPFVAVNGVCCDIDQTLKRFWEVENCGIERCDTKIFTKEESETLRKLENSISYTGERYKVGVLWKDDRPELPDNRHTVLTRLCNTENKLKKDPVVGAEYAQTIQAYIEKGYLRMVQPDEEITDAEEEIIRRAQQEAFPEEYMALTVGKEFPKKSLLSKLCPRIDDQGVMCCDGRLQFVECLPYDVRFPIILPRGHWVTRLIVKHHHELANHSVGTNFVLSQISGRFWIITACEEIREWENECNECKRRRAKTATQIMAPLPQVRLRFMFRAFD